MSIKTLWIQGPGGGALEYSAEDFRTIVTEVFAPGVLGGGFGVSERAAGANMTVTVAAGRAVIEGTDATGQGNYLARMDAAEEDVSIGAAPGSGTRHDLVGLRVLDVTAGGPSGQHQTEVVVVAGTASSSPADPAFPDSFLPLARVRVPTGTVSITNALIDDLREPARLAVGLVGTDEIDDGAVTNAKLRNSSALSVIGRSANSSGSPADIAAGTNHHVLRRSGTSLGFGLVDTNNIANGAVTNAKLPDAPGGSLNSGRVQYRRLGNMVFVWVTPTATADVTLPSGYRPAAEVGFPVVRSGVTPEQTWGKVTSAGAITIGLAYGSAGALYNFSFAAA